MKPSKAFLIVLVAVLVGFAATLAICLLKGDEVQPLPTGELTCWAAQHKHLQLINPTTAWVTLELGEEFGTEELKKYGWPSPPYFLICTEMPDG